MLIGVMLVEPRHIKTDTTTFRPDGVPLGSDNLGALKDTRTLGEHGKPVFVK
jgi:hypothetical protein